MKYLCIKCIQEEINTPPHMDIYLSSNTVNAAWMAHYGGIDGIIWAQLANELVPGITMGILPDIVLDRNNPPTAIKGDAYHEMAHASHFMKVGLFWWNHLTSYEVGQIMSNPDQDPYGNGTDPDAGYCAVAESWANHIGASFSISDPKIIDKIYMENDFIPNGLHWDLNDAINDDEFFLVNDVVGGFTNEMIFDLLNSTSIDVLKVRLWNEHGADAGIIGSHADYNDLFLSYGY